MTKSLDIGSHLSLNWSQACRASPGTDRTLHRALIASCRWALTERILVSLRRKILETKLSPYLLKVSVPKNVLNQVTNKVPWNRIPRVVSGTFWL